MAKHKKKPVKKKKVTPLKAKKHPWDETMVIVVMVVAALCILILLASYTSTVGQAYSSLPSEQGVKKMLSQCQILSGEGKTKGTIPCGRIRKTCVFAWDNDVLKKCNDVVTGSHRFLRCTPSYK